MVSKSNLVTLTVPVIFFLVYITLHFQVVSAVTESILFLGILAPYVTDFADACALIWPVAQYIDEAEVI